MHTIGSVRRVQACEPAAPPIGSGAQVLRYGPAVYLAIACAVALCTPYLLAQAGLAGTWTLDQSAGRGGGGRGGGVPGFPLATTLDIKVSPTEVIVDSNTGSAQSIQTFVYKLDGSTTNVPGPLGWETTAKAAMDGDILKVTVRRSIDGPNGPVGANVTDVYRVDGSILTIERTLGNTTQELVYRK
jgi:hypothetical protein